MSYSQTWSRLASERGWIGAAWETWWMTVRSIASPVFSSALANGLTREAATVVRHHLGELLSKRGDGGEADWASYQMLSGSANAAPALLKVLGSGIADAIRHRQRPHRSPRHDVRRDISVVVVRNRIRHGFRR